jgi:hypothetical protein
VLFRSLNRDASVGDDLVAAAYSLENESGSAVGGTLMYAGYQALLDGTVDEDLQAAANGLELGGEVGGNVNAEVDGEEGGPGPAWFMSAPGVQIPPVEPGLTVTGSARIGGDLTYESSTEARISPGAQIGGETVAEERPADEEEEEPASPVLDNLRSLIALVLVGLLLVWLAPGWTRRLAGTVLDRPLASLGWGLLSFVAFAVLGVAILLATILLAVIFGLLALGGLVALIIVLGVLAETALVVVFLISAGYLAQIVVSFLAGVLLVEAVRPGRGTGRVLPLVVGLILYVILRAIPWLGPIVGLAVVLLGLGALFRWIWATLHRRPAQPPPVG